MKKVNCNGLYQDEKGELWVVIHLDTGDELEWGQDISANYGFPQYTVITSGNCDFLDIEYKNSMRKVNNVKYKCIQLCFNSSDYVYINEKIVKEEIMDRVDNIDGDFKELKYFNSKYSDLIRAL